jgi:glutamate synthase (NADPH) small chain
MNTLLREYQALVLAGGSTIPRNLPAPGRAFDGVHFAMQYLTQQNKRVSGKDITGSEIMAGGKDVIVIGGGDTGSDCVGTANRQGAASVTQFEIMPMPPEKRNAHMPWPNYPMLLKHTTSHEEGCIRHWALNTKAFVGDEQGRLKGILVEEVVWETDQKTGRPVQFAAIPGTERELPCQLALLAMGFLHPQAEGMLQQLGIDLDERGNVKATEGVYQTNIAKVFTAGDMRRGQSLVVWAISEGREAARKVDEYLMGSSTLETKDF